MRVWIWLGLGLGLIAALIGLYVLLRGLSQREAEPDEEWPLGI